MARGSIAEEAESDFGRVLYSPAFRRLQLKTQVFPLEDNASVRSRLTHSLEVSHIGQQIATSVCELGFIADDLRLSFQTFVRTACLCHDIGNPPFGHFGETAIKDWFKKHQSEIITKVASTETAEFLARLYPDFELFDGNPQGFRIVSRLSRSEDQYGLNLTAVQLAANLKYTCPSTLVDDTLMFSKKPGYFVSETERVRFARRALVMADNARHPVSLIMEAADDIAYCMSDIEDAVEKRITDDRSFFEHLGANWAERRRKGVVDQEIDELLAKEGGAKATVLPFKAAFSRLAIRRATAMYKSNHEAVVSGHQASPLVDCDVALRALLDCFRQFCRQHVYVSPEAERLELAGYKAIKDILTEFLPLVLCSQADFEAADTKNALLRRLKNLLPKKHKLAYRETLADMQRLESLSEATLERFARLHLITDFVSGMTDRFAIETHRTLVGVGSGLRW